ncbi:MAG: carboxymuconolactone decarboxylase family protein [Jatrophihabitans sp.]
MARISLDPPRTTMVKLAEWYSRRRFGDVLEPAQAMAHNRKVLRTCVREEMSAERWSAVPSQIKTLAVMSAAATVGCEWCMDFGYWHAMDDGIDSAKIQDMPRWRESSAYTELERAAIEYAAAMSTTPIEVTDDQVSALREHLDEAQLVELTMMIAIENQRARFNSALGLASQGFAERCELRPTR